MEDGHAVECSVNDDLLASSSKLPTSQIPLSIEKGRSGIKIKWLSDLPELKLFLECQLKLSGECSFTKNNGGFHVLKCDTVTISFYQTTKTVNVQGAMKDVVKKNILSYATLSEDSSAETTALANHVNYGNFEDEVESEACDAVGKQTQDKDLESNIDAYEDTYLNDSAPSEFEKPQFCPGCKKNSIYINSLATRLEELEQKLKPKSEYTGVLTYNDLQAKLLSVTEERDSLLTTLKLLAKENASRPHSGDYKNGKDGRSDIIKGKGKASKGKKGNIDMGEPQHGNIENSKLPTPNVTSDGSKEHGNAKNEFSQQNRDQNGCDVVIIGDSITKHIHGHRLSRKHKVKNMSFPGATVEDMVDFVKPIIRKRPKKIILHVGTNNLKRDNPKKISKKIIDLANDLKKQHSSVEIAISSIIHRTDDTLLNSKVDKVNESLEKSCVDNNFGFICNNNIKHDCLNVGGLHLILKGTINLAANFRKHINLE
ncbi:Hypothetical predicted protein [Paramuricea clavata]|uniref:Uncharacterized protein n=1 Tax=Paramuricea clavata TaxID=317549 RepID=A0A6S7I5L6_PARCT|nr:Hypothetical predicted protein [Paramuricea clavata]